MEKIKMLEQQLKLKLTVKEHKKIMEYLYNEGITIIYSEICEAKRGF